VRAFDVTALITGATSGIGLEAAAQIAALGTHVVMVARDKGRGEEALSRVAARVPGARLAVLTCDTSSLDSVRTLAGEVLSRYPRLDLLVNNAGSVSGTRFETSDGFEWTFAANYLGHFLLTNLLLDRLRASAPARIVNVSSDAHRTAAIDFDNLQFEKGGYSIMRAYGRSKLAQVLFTRELARRVDANQVTVNALHPGAVATGIWRKAALPWYARAPIAIAKRSFMIAPAEGAARVVYVATSPALAGRSGGYYHRNVLVEPSRAARDGAVASRLWDLSAKWTHSMHA
jgi:NAD(P)-dependent dehydrogenase (short-subunit alcohol dehydrogenase family)